MLQVEGRVDVTRTFDGGELNAEYIFGLFSEPDHVSLYRVQYYPVRRERRHRLCYNRSLPSTQRRSV